MKLPQVFVTMMDSSISLLSVVISFLEKELESNQYLKGFYNCCTHYQPMKVYSTLKLITFFKKEP